MIFEVFSKDGRRMEHTEHIECVIDSYEKGNLQSMNSIGWKFKLDGKVISLTKLVEALDLKNKSKVNPSIVKTIDKPNTSNDSIKSNTVNETETNPKPKRKVRKIRCITNDTTYKNMSACAKDLDIDPATISYVMQKGTNEYKGYKFEFVED